MAIFDFKDDEALGKVVAVDTATVVVRVDSLDRLRTIQVNRLTVLRSSKAGHHLIGLITRITRKIDEEGKSADTASETGDAALPENNLVRITLIGTFKDRDGEALNVFLRTLETVPDIDSFCFALDGKRLTAFMQVISNVAMEGPRLSLGRFTLDDDAEAFLNGNKLFQRHAVIVGSTGSGKSWTTARLLDQMAALPQANAILFDIHGEYKPLKGDAFRHIRIAGPKDVEKGSVLKDGVLYLPYWLLGYEAIVSLFVDRSDQNAPNQSMMITKNILEAKRAALTGSEHAAVLENFTIDSPVPFDLNTVLEELTNLNCQMEPGTRSGEKQGPYHGKFTRLISRLEAKRADRRLGFLFQPPKECMAMSWLEEMIHQLIAGRGAQSDKKGGIKIIDFSEVPSDVLPLMVSLLARAIFTTNQWTERSKRHPIALMCDEAHLYIPERAGADSSDAVSVEIFERIAKEGRKYGIGLVVISQRPAEVNRTVLSQCSNVIAMRLTNGDDQAVIKRLLPDSLGSFGDLLPVLDTGEALVVGDASLLPTRIRVAKPSQEPDSQTVSFWDRWNDSTPRADTKNAVSAWRQQSFQL
ncbi:MAG: ATP-binding protein [Magnetococcales bacterium]|nr:ATP-binding protein [Magnetococcales bacterium]